MAGRSPGHPRISRYQKNVDGRHKAGHDGKLLPPGLTALAHMPAMADADRLAGERVSLEGGEEQSHVGHVLDRGELLVHRLGQHDLLDYALLADAERLCLLGDLLLDERRLDETRANDIGAHAMRGAFLCHHSREAEQAVLGRHIGGLQRRSLVAVHRSHIEEHARFLRIEVLDAGLGGEEGAVEMDGEHLLPLGEGKVLDRMHDLDAGIGDENVDPAKGLDRLLDPFVDLVLLGDVHANADRSFLIAQLLRGLRRDIGFAVGDRDAAAGLDETLGDAMTDAARGAGNESNLAVELHETRSLTFGTIVTILPGPNVRSATLCAGKEGMAKARGLTSSMVITIASWDGCRDRG